MDANRKAVAHALPIDEIQPSPENQRLYCPIAPDDAATIALADSIKERGILEPIVISEDNYIMAGYRRHCAARMAGLREVPCRRHDPEVWRGDGETASDEFLKLLREYNRQRVKSHAEDLREAIVDIDPNKAHSALTAYRKRKAKIKVEPIELRKVAPRKQISSAKTDFLQAIIRAINALKEFWPVTVRQIHYPLLNDPPLKNAANSDTRYRNDYESYHALVDLTTRARHAGHIPYSVIHDPTRPATTWKVYRHLPEYYAQKMKDLLNDYWRDAMQSQPNHFEIVAEKLGLQKIVEDVAQKFCIPVTPGKGQCSTPALYRIAQRYKRSGKERLIVLALSDCDPDGDCIAHAIGQRLRDDYHIDKVDVVKVGLTMKQVRQLKLPPSFERAKTGSSNYRRYVESHGTDFVWELEALPPKKLQELLTDAIDAVIDREAFNHEIAQERADAAHNAAVREIVLRTLKEETHDHDREEY